MESAASNKDRMIAGRPYDALDPQLVADRAACQKALAQYNATDAPESAEQRARLRALVGSCGEGTTVNAPLRADYGYNLHLGRNVFVNYDLVALDCAPIRLGDSVMIGPRCQLLTALHPVDDIAARISGVETAAPIDIEDHVWLGAGVIVNPGVRIGAGSVIGSGSVVTRDIPAGVFAAGNPCRVVRPLAPADAPAESTAR